MFQRFERAVDHAEIIGLEDLLMVLVADLLELRVGADARAIVPGVEAAVLLDDRADGAAHLLALADVGDDVIALAAIGADVVANFPHTLLVAGEDDDIGAALRGHFRGGQADARRPAGDDDGLLLDRLEFHLCPPGEAHARPRAGAGATSGVGFACSTGADGAAFLDAPQRLHGRRPGAGSSPLQQGCARRALKVDTVQPCR